MAARNVQINEKEILATTASTDEPLEANEAAVVTPERNLARAIWTIVYGVALPCIPIIIICSVLLYIIFKHRLHLDPGLAVLQVLSTDSGHNETGHVTTNFASRLGKFKKQIGEPAYYVQYNPSTITTIASWTSRIIPYLQSSIMALVAFFAARHIVLKSKHGDDSQLPNPEQLALLIGTLGGSGFTPLKDVLLYRLGRKGRLVNPLPAAVAALTTITVMALIIPLIDTWFGIATTATPATQLKAAEHPALRYGTAFSYNEDKICENGPNQNPGILVNETAFWPCNVYVDYDDPRIRYVPGLDEASNVALGTSERTKINNFTDDSGHDIYYLGNPAQSFLQDYQATTLATASRCEPMTLKQCNLTIFQDGSLSGTFHCTEAFVGSLTSKQLNHSATGVLNSSTANNSLNVGLAFSGNAALTDVTGRILSIPSNEALYYHGDIWDPEMYRTNPVYYGAWATGFPGPNFNAYTDGSGDFKGDSAYYWDWLLGGVWMLNCSTTVYNLTYTWVNGTVASHNTSLASIDMAALLTSPFVVGRNSYTDTSLYMAASIAGAANNSIGIANTFAAQYSKLLLAYSVSALEPQIVLAQQDRIVYSSVARVPLIPLYLLLATKALYVLAVIILAIAAYAFTHPAETEIVKDQLTVKGLTSAHFDRPDVMQEYAVQQLQNFEASKSSSPPDIDGSSKPLLQHAATAPPDTPAAKINKPNEPKIGLVPAVDGTWQWVVKADGVWNSVKPIVKTIVKDIVLQEAQAGNLGTTGNVINAYTGKPLK